MSVPLGLSGCGDLTLEMVRAGVFGVCVVWFVVCCMGWTLPTSLLVSNAMCRDWRGGVGHGLHGVWGAGEPFCTVADSLLEEGVESAWDGGVRVWGRKGKTLVLLPVSSRAGALFLILDVETGLAAWCLELHVWCGRGVAHARGWPGPSARTLFLVVVATFACVAINVFMCGLFYARVYIFVRAWV